jgi:nucleotide-binding universal stress UspA family protein
MIFPMPATEISVQTILFATDFSEASESARNYALGLARFYGSKLITAHVMSRQPHQLVPPESAPFISDQLENIAKDEMQQWSSRLTAAGLFHEEALPSGDVAECLSDLIGSKQVDLLVLGTHGRTGIGKLLIGSVAEEMVRQVKCPVLVVGPRVLIRRFDRLSSERGGLEFAINWKRILFATDFSPASLASATKVMSLAEEHDSELSLLHVVPAGQPEKEENSNVVSGTTYYARRLQKLVPQDHNLKKRPRFLVEHGDVAEVIVTSAARRLADLIVLGARSAEHHLLSATHFPTSVAHRVMAHADCPVLLLPR